MLSSIKKALFALVSVLVLANLVHAAQICRICENNSVVRFQLWSNVDGRMIDQASVYAGCASSVSATGRFQYRAQNGIAYFSGVGLNQQCVLGAGSGNNSKWTQCCDIPYGG